MLRILGLKSLVLILCATLSVALAQSEPAAALQVAEHPEHGPYLTDQEGNSLYATLDDADGGAGCDASCMRYWPPFEGAAAPTVGEGVDASLADVRELGDGTSQVVYNGWPLYRFAQDRSAGNVRGHGNADTWYLLAPSGDPILPAEPDEAEADDEAAAGAPAPQAQDPELAGAVAEGEGVFARVCASCHGASGEGGFGPRLSGNARLEDAHAIADAVVNGRGYMPALGGQMTTEETAAVLTFVRNSWGNGYGPVSTDIVEEVSE